MRLDDRLAATKYEPLHDRTLSLPDDSAFRPDPGFLAQHARWAGGFRGE